MIIEIGYTYQLDKKGPAQTSWTYFYVKGDDTTKAKAKAKTYWKKFVAELGWGRKAKLTHTEVIANEKTYTPDFIVVSSSELPAARKRRSTSKEPPAPARKRRVSRSSRTTGKTSVSSKT